MLAALIMPGRVGNGVNIARHFETASRSPLKLRINTRFAAARIMTPASHPAHICPPKLAQLPWGCYSSKLFHHGSLNHAAGRARSVPVPAAVVYFCTGFHDAFHP